MRRNVCGNKPDFPKPESPGGRARHIEVPAMDGIKCAAKECNVHALAISR